MLTARQAMGARGERLAEEWLALRGWRVLDRRFRSGHRDIDLVVERAGAVKATDASGGVRMVAFVEVKTRASGGFGGPLAAVHWRKQREMARAARDWIAKNRRPGDNYRFDVIGIVDCDQRPEIVHVENAFVVK